MTQDSPQQAQPSKPDRPMDIRWLARWSFVVILVGAFATFAFQNSETATVEFFGWSFDTPIILLLVGAAVVGIVIWELAGAFRRRRRTEH
ncbi:MAG: lipopolysaccharide assembly protein LapA domain-containing protein [Acidimicrobiia bacterium]|nr:lipopolysaccharide assembly protein LapA domain-containing protein [Acidimicrobiia bacterium]